MVSQPNASEQCFIYIDNSWYSSSKIIKLFNLIMAILFGLFTMFIMCVTIHELKRYVYIYVGLDDIGSDITHDMISYIMIFVLKTLAEYYPTTR